ncbi:MAG: PorT family protein [Prevotellaceae bacterium]|jgi:hypothetical protein|nr:PorT family protein [Prevotellaceae bacterium]
MKKIFISGKKSVRQTILLLLAWTFSLSAIARNENDTVFYREKDIVKYYAVQETRIILGQKCYVSMFLDFGADMLDKRNMFTGSMHASAGDFPKLRNSGISSFSIYSMVEKRSSGFFSIMSGIGIEWANYRFSHDVTIKDIDGVATQVPVSSIFNTFSYMKKSKLAATYVQIPLLLKLDFRRFFVAAGVTGGINLNSRTKVVFVDTRGRKQTYKSYDVNLAPFKYGYTVRAGYGLLAIYAHYYVSPLFSKGEGPKVYPFVTGVSLKF